MLRREATGRATHRRPPSSFPLSPPSNPPRTTSRVRRSVRVRTYRCCSELTAASAGHRGCVKGARVGGHVARLLQRLDKERGASKGGGGPLWSSSDHEGERKTEVRGGGQEEKRVGQCGEAWLGGCMRVLDKEDGAGRRRDKRGTEEGEDGRDG
ncbi:hypothetical protein FKP32DRAFT_385570 [Trametes sanguinea]|nr:hypothetical protein FKP32DRAFT_385570 [Trametes sanguinea]